MSTFAAINIRGEAKELIPLRKASSQKAIVNAGLSETQGLDGRRELTQQHDDTESDLSIDFNINETIVQGDAVKDAHFTFTLQDHAIDI